MFKAVFSNNKIILTKMIEAILGYCKMDIDIKDKELIIRNNELSLDHYQDKQLICDYIIKLNEYTDLNIEINKSYYTGLPQRNLTYSFKIYYEHFKSGDNYKEFNNYNLLQVNFNNYQNPNHKNINRFFMMDIDDITNTLSKNLCIINIDIASCFKLVYNNTKLKEISNLERFAGIVYTDNLEDISSIIGDDLLSMEEKEKFLSDIKEKSKKKQVLEAIKFEDSIEYRFDLVREEALEHGIEQGIEQGKNEALIQTIKEMLKNNASIDFISKVTKKPMEEINSIKETMK